MKWNENRLNALELLDEGEIKFNGRIQINRKYVCGKTNDSSSYDHYTLVQDTSIEKKLGVIGIVHGFAQCSDTFMETQVQLAMNGYIVYAIDLEGYGYTAGARICGLRIVRFHHQVATLLQLASTNYASLPLFLLGHSMGCLTINTFL